MAKKVKGCSRNKLETVEQLLPDSLAEFYRRTMPSFRGLLKGLPRTAVQTYASSTNAQRRLSVSIDFKTTPLLHYSARTLEESPDLPHHGPSEE